MTFLLVLAALLMLGIMVMVHECGHFFAARLTGIPVRSFGIGFGPKLLSWKGKKHETEYTLRLIPAGGYCAFYGEDDPDAEKQQDPRAFNNHAVWRRMLTILMGPVMNFVLALVVAIGYYAVAGEIVDIDYGRARIDSVIEGSAAEAAGFKAGDLIESVNGKITVGLNESNTQHTALEAIGAYKQGDEPLEIVVSRGSDQVLLKVAPEFNKEENRMLIGINTMLEYSYKTEKCSLWRAAQLGSQFCVQAGTSIWNALKNLIFHGEGIEDTGGPVRIIQTITEETRRMGFEAYINMLVVISVNLGLVNLLPIPGLDGCRAIFLAIEGIFRKPIPRKVEAYIHMAGYLLLMALFVFLTFNDILHLF